ncbi:MAG: peptidylprolyl isomerase [Sulfurovum sp.]|nr:peptidylprolyl isomerase [Sulfurovum sp.]
MLHAAEKKAPVVVLETNVGKIELKMFPKAAPLAVENFVTHVKNGYYDGLIFHRVIKDFMIQGGDPTGTGRGGESIWHKEFKNEYAPNLTFDRPFLLAMANHGPNTNGSQFFITTVPTPHLNGGYTIFGEVIKGKDVVRKIENVTTGAGDRPLFDMKIKKAYVK